MAESATMYNREKSQSAQLRIAQNTARKQKTSDSDKKLEEDFDRSMDNNEVTEENVDNFVKGKVAKLKKGTKDQRRVQAKKLLLIRKVKRKIKKETFGGTLFFATLLVALLKDALDVFTLSFFGPALAFVINPLLSILLWIGGSPKAETKLQRIVIVNLIEAIPMLSFLPTWAMMVIKIKLEQNKKVHRLVRILKRLEKKTK